MNEVVNVANAGQLQAQLATRFWDSVCSYYAVTCPFCQQNGHKLYECQLKLKCDQTAKDMDIAHAWGTVKY